MNFVIMCANRSSLYFDRPAPITVQYAFLEQLPTGELDLPAHESLYLPIAYG
jgi:hypothetical protein